MKSIVIAGYARSPFQFARKGSLINLRPDDLAAQVLAGLVSRLDLNPALLEDVIMGCAYLHDGHSFCRRADYAGRR